MGRQQHIYAPEDNTLSPQAVQFLIHEYIAEIGLEVLLGVRPGVQPYS